MLQYKYTRDALLTHKGITHMNGLRSSRPKFISPEIMSPETRVMLPEIHSHVARNPKSCRPKFYRVFKLEEK